MSNFDQDAFDASLDIVGRTGAKQLEFGYLNDDVPIEKGDWWASVLYHGAKIAVEHQAGPVEAVEALARRLLDGGLCTYCGQRIALADYPGKRCRWTRHGKEWIRGCTDTHHDRIPRIEAAAKQQARGPEWGLNG